MFNNSIFRVLYSIINEATRKVPSLKYAVGVLALAALVSIIYSFTNNPTLIWVGSTIVFGFMVLILVFAKLATSEKKTFHWAGMVLMWFIIMTFIFSAILFLSSLFFNVPVKLQYLLTGRNSNNKVILSSDFCNRIKSQLLNYNNELEACISYETDTLKRVEFLQLKSKCRSMVKFDCSELTKDSLQIIQQLNEISNRVHLCLE